MYYSFIISQDSGVYIFYLTNSLNSVGKKMCYTPDIFDNIFQWQLFLERDTLYFNDILWAQAYTVISRNMT